MYRNRRLYAVVAKEVKEILRDHLYLLMAFVVPVLLTVMFGFGLTMDVKNIPFAVVDLNRSSLSREYVDRLGRSPYFTLKDYTSHTAPVEQGLTRGLLRLGVIIPPDFDRLIQQGQETEVQALIDGAFPDRAVTIRSYLEVINLEFNREILAGGRFGSPEAVPWINVEPRAWYNSTLESKNFIVPGLIAANLFFYPALLASIAVVREKESGSIFNIYCSPIRRWEYVVGKIIPYWAIGGINYLLLFLVADYIFAVPFRGSFIFLSVSAVLYLGVCTSLGLLMSILFKTQVAAMLITTVITLIPAFIYSGFFISVASMGPEAQFMAYILPVTYFMEIVRGVFLKGLGIRHYWSNVVILAGFLAIFVWLGIHKLKKRVG